MTTEIIYGVVGLVLGLLGSGVYSYIRAFAEKGEKISIELSEAFAASGKTFGAINEAIKNDDKIDANELKEIVSQGKETLIQFKDVILTVKPK